MGNASTEISKLELKLKLLGSGTDDLVGAAVGMLKSAEPGWGGNSVEKE